MPIFEHKSLVKRLTYFADFQADSLAIKSKDHSYSYQQLLQKAIALGHFFSNQTPIAGRLLFLCEDLADVVLCALGCALSNRAFAVLPPSTPLPFLKACQMMICPDLTLSSQNIKHLISQQNSTGTEHNHNPNALFYIGLSSGSTGLPKAVVRTLTSWEESFWQLEQRIKLQSNSMVGVLGTLSFSLPVFSALQTIYSGACLCLANSQHTSQMTHLFSAPAPLKLFLTRFQEASLPNLKMLVIGGDFCTREIVQLKPPQTQIAYFYGTVELSLIALKFLQEDHAVPQVGDLFDVVEVCLEGEQIFVKSRQSCVGYLSQGRLKSFPEWIATGDLGTFDGNGQLCLKGRIGRQFLVNGVIVYPEVIENQLRQLEAIQQCVIFQSQTKSGYDELCAVLVTNQDVSKKGLKHACQKFLPASQIPKRFFLAESLPQTHSGKIDFLKIQKDPLFLQNCIALSWH